MLFSRGASLIGWTFNEEVEAMMDRTDFSLKTQPPWKIRIKENEVLVNSVAFDINIAIAISAIIIMNMFL